MVWAYHPPSPPPTLPPPRRPPPPLPPSTLQVGDRIVIASSSFVFDEVDEATITAVTAVPGGAVLTLDTPLSYTHLGTVVSYPADMDPLQHTLDMRAEVAVLTRSVVVQVGGCRGAWVWWYHQWGLGSGTACTL